LTLLEKVGEDEPYSLILIALLSFWLRIRDLAYRPLWFDEAMEYWVATAVPGQLLPTIKAALQDPPLYSLLLHGWLHVGDNEFIVRYPSLLLSLLALPAVFYLGRLFGDRYTGLIAALLVAVLPPQIRYAQEAGQYALIIAALSFHLIALVWVCRHYHPMGWLFWCVSGLLCIYSFYGSVIIIVGAMAAVFLWQLYHKQLSNLVYQIGAIGLLIIGTLPLLPWIRSQLLRGPTQDAFQVVWLSWAREVKWLWHNTHQLLSFQVTSNMPPVPYSEKLLLLAWLLLLSTLMLASIKTSYHPPARLLGLMLLVSWAVYYFLGRLGAYPYGGLRHSLILTPLLLPMVAIGIQSLWRIWAGLGISWLLVILLVSFIVPPEPPQDLRSVTVYWLQNSGPQTPTYVYYGAVPGFRYQLQQAGLDSLSSRGNWYQDCWQGQIELCAVDEILYGRWLRHLSPEEKVANIQATMGAPRQFWLISSHTREEEQEELLIALQQAGYKEVNYYTAVGSSAHLWRLLD
jgi:uncharacterized membrane protein